MSDNTRTGAGMNFAMIKSTDLRILRHTLGAVAHVRRSKWGYRNRFCGTTDAITRLVDAGLMKPVGNSSELTGGDQMYIATEEGMDAIGLTPTQKKRAMES